MKQQKQKKTNMHVCRYVCKQAFTKEITKTITNKQRTESGLYAMAYQYSVMWWPPAPSAVAAATDWQNQNQNLHWTIAEQKRWFGSDVA